MKFRRHMLLILACLLLCCTVSIGQESVAGFSFSNDLFYNTDRHYTHGTRLFYTYKDTPEFVTKIFKFDGDYQFGVALAQHLYSPSDITNPDLIVNDRPYVGYLYLGAYINRYHRNLMDGFELDVGVVGPLAYGEETQKFVHEMVDSKTPMGWDNQINNEIAINAIYQRKHKWNNKVIDVIPHYGGCLGTTFVYANVGGMVRLGYNLPNDFGVYGFEPTPRKSWGIPSTYVFANVDGRAVLHNTAVEGNLFSESHGVEKEYFVADLGLGVGVRVYRLEAIYEYVYRTKEFTEQEEPNEYGTMSFLWRY